MNVVDSSAWPEYFAEGPNAQRFAPAIEAVSELLVPTISVNKRSGAFLCKAERGRLWRQWPS